MKKFVYFLVTILASGLLCSCGSAFSDKKKQSAENLQIYASFYPIFDFTSKIAGEYADVYNMVPSGAEAHDWEPSPVDIVNLEKADMFIYSGTGLEFWTNDVLASLENQELTAVDTSRGISLIDEKETGLDDVDPHIWLDPQNAKIMGENIKNALIAANPENKSSYEENYMAFAAGADQLHQEFLQGLSGLPQKEIIVVHPAYAYLCKAYDLYQTGINRISSDGDPDPARMAEVIRFAKEQKVTAIFYGEPEQEKIAKSVASEIDAQIALLSPVEGLLSDREGEDYFSVMRTNLDVLKQALQETDA